MLIDTHAHLCEEAFEPDLDQVLHRAREAGVEAILAVGETLQDAWKNLDLSRQQEMILPAAGLYPGNADLDHAQQLIEFICRHQDQLSAIGEVGLDFRLAETEQDKELQLQVLDQFIELSLQTGLPLNVHSRSAGRHAVSRLLDKGAQKVQLHAFDGKPKYALPAVEQGYFFSFPPSLIRSRQKQKLAKQLPISCMLAETDSPVLGAEADERNEPANLSLVIQALAEIKDVHPEYLRSVLRDNCQQLYGI
ncbi:MAG: TatD family hydrolase [Desulfohalobiaceae bacterium]